MKPLMRAAFRMYGTVMPGRAARTFENLIVRPYRVPDVRLGEPAVAATTRRIPYAHGWLHAIEYGQGPAVLLVHGWGGRGRSLRGFVDPLVARGLRVVVPDLPAHGNSSGKRTNLIESGGALLQLEKAAGPFAGVLTHSFGGAVAAFAWNHGFSADRAVMLAPPQDLYDLMIPVAETIGFPRDVGARALARFANQLDFQWDDLRVDRLVSAVESPLLVIHDAGDRITPVEHGRQVAAAAPNARFHETNGLGHRDVLVDAAVLDRAVEFLTR